MIKKYKNILFDMDGVLINSMKCHTHAWKLAMHKHKVEVSEQEVMNLAGMTALETVQILCENHNKEYSIKFAEKIKLDKATILKKIFKVELYPHVLEEIFKLKKSNFTLALVSGGRKHEVDLTIDKYFKNIFDIVITGDDVKFGKPNPEPYNTAIKKLNLNKSETVIIEDALSGIQSANSAKIDVLALTTSFPEKELSNATKIFSSHYKLFKYLNP